MYPLRGKNPDEMCIRDRISAWLRILSIASLVYLLTGIPVYVAAKNFVHVVMIWNLFLAALPLLFAWLVRREVLSGRSGKTHGIKAVSYTHLDPDDLIRTNQLLHFFNPA